MTKEQEQAIETIEEMVKSYIEADECGLSNNDFKHEIKAMQTVLSMLKEKDEQIAKYEKIYKEYDCYRWVKELDKKNKMIDLMAEEINETDRGYTDYCEFKMVCDRKCKDCIKQYFERKCEENG